MKSGVVILAMVLTASQSAVADDFKTIDGKEYRNVAVSRVEPDGIVLRSKSGISKVYFTELPKDVQERFGYNPEKAAEKATKEAIARSWQKTDATEPVATSGIETLSPITIKFKDEILNALKMTDKLDALYKRGCTSAEFIAAATPIESVFLKLNKQLPKGDPGRDLLSNTFEGYQQTAIAMVAKEQGRDARPDISISVAGVRKGLLMKVLEGKMTPNERTLYQAWLQGHP